MLEANYWREKGYININSTIYIKVVLTYLEGEHIDIGYEIPFGIAILVVAGEAQTGIIANGIGQEPGVIILKAYASGCHHGIPEPIGYTGATDKLVVFHILHWIDFHKFHEYEGTHQAAKHFAYHGFRWRRF